MTTAGQNNLQSEPNPQLKLPRRIRRRKVRASALKWSRPGTPSVHWEANAALSEVGPQGRRKELSARELGGVLWRLQLPQTGIQHGSTHMDLGNQKSIASGSAANELTQSPPSVTGPKNGYTYKLEPLFNFPNPEMERATKWNPVCLETSNMVEHTYDHSKHCSDQSVHDNSTIYAIKFELEKAHECIYELETDKRSSKQKLEYFLKKLSQERAAWRSSEHERIRSIIDDAKADLRSERKNRQRLEIVNSKLLDEVEDAKILTKRYMQDYEKERKARELTEEVCNELAKEIGEDKAEVEELKRESAKMHEEVEDERRMLQIAEAWREERVQMKLLDAKVMIEERYTYMNKLASDIEAFLLNSRSSISDKEEDMRKAEIFQQAAGLVNNVLDIKEIRYDPSNLDDIYSVLEGDAYTGNGVEREIEHYNKVIYGPETVSQIEDRNGCEGTPVSEVLSARKTHNKTVSAIARLWRSGSKNGDNFNIISVDGVNGRLSHNRVSNRAIISPNRWSLHGTQKSSLKAKFLEARSDCPKIQLKQVLQHKI